MVETAPLFPCGCRGICWLPCAWPSGRMVRRNRPPPELVSGQRDRHRNQSVPRPGCGQRRDRADPLCAECLGFEPIPRLPTVDPDFWLCAFGRFRRAGTWRTQVRYLCSRFLWSGRTDWMVGPFGYHALLGDFCRDPRDAHWPANRHSRRSL